MKFKVSNFDVLDPQALFAADGLASYFSDTKYYQYAFTRADGARVLQVYALANAMLPGKAVTTFNCVFSPSLSGLEFNVALDRVFGRYPRIADFHISMMRSPWDIDQVKKTFVPVEYDKGVTLEREVRDGSTVWSPFFRSAPLGHIPSVWTKDTFVRMLQCGQFEDLSFSRSAVSEGSDGQKKLVQTEIKTGVDCAAYIVRSSFYEWDFTYEGIHAVATAIGGNSYTRIAVVPTLWGPG